MRFLTATTLSILILALFVGLIAAYGIRTLLQPEEAEPPPEPERLTVPLASQDLDEGRTLVMGDVILAEMTREEMRQAGLSNAVTSTDLLFGRTLKKPVAAGAGFRTTDFYLQGQGPSYLRDLPEGYRAVSLVIPLSSGGYANPGSFVDVMFRAAPAEGSETRPAIPDVTIPLIENAKVLAVERPQPRTFGNDGNGMDTSGGIDLRNREVSQTAPNPTFILAVTPQDAVKLEAVKGRGELSLASRREAGFEVRPTATSLEDILGLEPPLPPPAPVPPFITQIYEGGQMSVNTFPVDQNPIELPAGALDN